MKTEEEIRAKLAFLETQLADGDRGAEREIQRLKWVLGEGRDYVSIVLPK